MANSFIFKISKSLLKETSASFLLILSSEFQSILRNSHSNRALLKSGLYIVLGIGAKLVSNWKQNLLYTKRLQLFCRKIISIIRGMKGSSLACVFCRPQRNSKEGPLGIEFCRSF